MHIGLIQPAFILHAKKRLLHLQAPLLCLIHITRELMKASKVLEAAQTLLINKYDLICNKGPLLTNIYDQVFLKGPLLKHVNNQFYAHTVAI